MCVVCSHIAICFIHLSLVLFHIISGNSCSWKGDVHKMAFPLLTLVTQSRSTLHNLGARKIVNFKLCSRRITTMWHWNGWKSDNLNQLKTVQIFYNYCIQLGNIFWQKKREKLRCVGDPSSSRATRAPGPCWPQVQCRVVLGGLGPDPPLGGEGGGKRDRLHCRRG